MRKIYLTESQFNYILEQQMLNEGVLRNLFTKLFGRSNAQEMVSKIIALVSAGIITVSMAVDMINFET